MIAANAQICWEIYEPPRHTYIFINIWWSESEVPSNGWPVIARSVRQSVQCLLADLDVTNLHCCGGFKHLFLLLTRRFKRDFV